MALRERAGFVEWAGPNAPIAPGLKALLEKSKSEGWLKSEHFSATRKIATEQARGDRVLLGIGAGREFSPIEPTEDEIIAAMGKIDYVQILIENAPKLRNRLAHGSSTLSPRSPITLTTVAEAINQLFVPAT
jgi:hypothetical protein